MLWIGKQYYHIQMKILRIYNQLDLNMSKNTNTLYMMYGKKPLSKNLKLFYNHIATIPSIPVKTILHFVDTYSIGIESNCIASTHLNRYRKNARRTSFNIAVPQSLLGRILTSII